MNYYVLLCLMIYILIELTSKWSDILVEYECEEAVSYKFQSMNNSGEREYSIIKSRFNKNNKSDAPCGTIHMIQSAQSYGGVLVGSNRSC